MGYDGANVIQFKDIYQGGSPTRWINMVTNSTDFKRNSINSKKKSAYFNLKCGDIEWKAIEYKMKCTDIEKKCGDFN